MLASRARAPSTLPSLPALTQPRIRARARRGGARSQERLRCLLRLAEQLAASECLDLVPVVLPEALLATKEVNEKTRTAAFQLLLSLGRHMQELGTGRPLRRPADKGHIKPWGAVSADADAGPVAANARWRRAL